MRAFCPECGTTVPIGGAGQCYLGHSLHAGPAGVGATRGASALATGAAVSDSAEPELWVADLGPAEAGSPEAAPRQPGPAPAAVPPVGDARRFDELSSAFDDLADGFDAEGLEELVSAMTELGLESDGSDVPDLLDELAAAPDPGAGLHTGYDDLFSVETTLAPPADAVAPAAQAAEPVPLPPPPAAERLDPTEPDIAVWEIGAEEEEDETSGPGAAHADDLDDHAALAGGDDPAEGWWEGPGDPAGVIGDTSALETLEALWGDALDPDPGGPAGAFAEVEESSPAPTSVAQFGPGSGAEFIHDFDPGVASGFTSEPETVAPEQTRWAPPSGHPLGQLLPPSFEEPEPEHPEASVAATSRRPPAPELNLRNFTARPARGRFRRR